MIASEMIAPEILSLLARVNLAAAAAIVLVLVLRKLARPRFGARIAYALWLLPVLAAAAVLAPARVILEPRPAPADPAVMRMFEAAMTGPTGRPAVSPPMPQTTPDLNLLILAVWLAGVVAAAVIMILLQRRFTAAARKGATGPAVVGVIAPRIVTPANFEQRFSAEEQALVLAHERAHIARQDSRLNGLSAALQCLFWFNPMIHLAAHLMRIDQEMACDELVVSRFPNARRAYAEALVKVQLAVRPLPLGCHWPSASEHPLVERIAMLKASQPGRRRRLAGGAALTVLSAATALGAWASQPPQVRLTPAAAPVPVAPAPPAAPQAAEAPATAPAKAATPVRPAPAEAAPPRQAAPTQVAALDPPLPIDPGELPRAPVKPPADVTPSSLSDPQRQTLRDHLQCQMTAARALDDGSSSEDAIAAQVEARCEAQYQAYRQAQIAANPNSTVDQGWLLDNTRRSQTRIAIHSLRQSKATQAAVGACVGGVADQFSADAFDQLVDRAVQQCGALMPRPVAPTGSGAARPELVEAYRRLDEGHDKTVRAAMTAELRRRLNTKPSQPAG
jgi:beta-lactamase regulating signal transducer with metallopeptidase domain